MDGGAWRPAGLETAWRVENLTNGTEYGFEVRAVNAHGEGVAATIEATPMLEITAIPTAPQALHVRATNSARAELDWAAPSNAFFDNERNLSKLQGYRIEVCRTGCDEEANWHAAVENTRSLATRYVHQVLAPGVIRANRYRVRAININGKAGPWSNEATLPPTELSVFHVRATGSETLEVSVNVLHPDGTRRYVRYREDGDPMSMGNASFRLLRSGTLRDEMTDNVKPSTRYRIDLDVVESFDSGAGGTPRWTEWVSTPSPGETPTTSPYAVEAVDAQVHSNGAWRAAPGAKLALAMGGTGRYRVRTKACEGSRTVTVRPIESPAGALGTAPVTVSPSQLELACNGGAPGDWHEVTVSALALADYGAGSRAWALLLAPLDVVYTHRARHHRPGDLKGYLLSSGTGAVRIEVRAPAGATLPRPGGFGIAAVEGRARNLALSWTAVDGASGYEVQWRRGPHYAPGATENRILQAHAGLTLTFGEPVRGPVTARVRAYSDAAVSPWVAAVSPWAEATWDARPPTLAAHDTAVNEADGSVGFLVTLSPAASGTVTVDYTTANGTALAGADYTATSGTLTFAPGETEQTTKRVPIVNDGEEDSGETFRLVLSDVRGRDADNGAAVIGDGEATATILNREQAAAGLVGFTLVDAGANRDLMALADGTAVALGALLAPSYGIRADTGPGAAPGSVRFALSGAKTVTRTDDAAPYSLYGDGGGRLNGEGLPPGSYTLRATSYAEAGGRGAALGAIEVSFTVTAGALGVTTPGPFTVAEGETAVAALGATATGTGEPASWSIPAGAAGGADGAAFALDADGRLAFAAAKDFEAPDDADGDGTYAVTVEVAVGAQRATAALVVRLGDANEAPVARAAADRRVVREGAAVTLDAGASTDPDAGDTLAYAWTQTDAGGPRVALSDAAAARPAFTAPEGLAAETELAFTLRVTDAAGLHAEDTVAVTVSLVSEVSIAAVSAYAAEGAEAVFRLSRAGSAAAALTVPVSVAEDGAMLGTPVPGTAAFAAGARETELRVPTAADGAREADSRVTAQLASGAGWWLAPGAESASVTVLDDDAAPAGPGTASDVTVWSADMTVAEYVSGIGADSAHLFSNQAGSAGLRAKSLWYDTRARKLRLRFDRGVAETEVLTLHLGGRSLRFPESSAGDSSFSWEDIAAVGWRVGDTVAVRISKPSAQAVSSDAALASLDVEGAQLRPAFDAGVLVYRAAAEAETVTVTAAASDAGAAVSYGPAADADAGRAGHQVAVAAGETLVAVTVTAADGVTERRYRVVAARGAADGAPENTAPAGLPAIAGTPQVGETLTASAAAITDADGTENAAFAWQWLADGGAGDVAIAGATGATYTAAAADAGRTLRVRVTFTDDKGAEETLTSVATDAVVDRRPVAATLSVGAGAAQAGRFRVRIAFGDAVTGLGAADFAAARVGGGAAAVTDLTEAETGRTWAAWVAAAEAGRYTVRLAAGAAQAGARRSAASVLAVDVDAAGNATAVAGPVVTAVALAAAPDGTWTDGETVRLMLEFSEPVTVSAEGGTPTVGIGLDGSARRAAYASGSGTLAVFSYRVTAEDGTVSAASVAADSLAPNGGTIRDAGGRDADLAHPGIGDAAEPETVSTAPPLTGFVLVDAGSGAQVALADGAAVVLADPASGSYGIVASVAADAGVGSVRLELAGAKTAAFTDDAAPFSLHGDADGAVAGAGLPAGSYTLEATAYPQAGGGGAALGTLTVSFTVAAGEAVAPDALTASFTGVPAAHGGPGSAAFTFELAFSESPKLSYKTLRDRSFAVTGGKVKKAKRKTKGSNRHWTIAVEPAGWDGVSLALPGGRACGTHGAICTADGKVLANTAAAAVPGPLALSVADARVDEAPGALLAFAVTLNRAAGAPVTVDYATADGTATAGADYTAASGTLTFTAGETAKTVNVTVLDDAHDDTGETLTLTLSNATGARIRDGEATGTIENSDPIPQAWLARFGRTVADHVVDAVAERLTGASGGGSQVTLGGQRVPLDGVAGSAGNGPSSGAAAGNDARERAAAADTLAAFADRISGDGAATGRGTAWARWGGGEDAAKRRESRGLTERELLLGSSFVLALGGTEAGGTGTAWTAWGRAAASRFDGEADGLVLDGDVTTFTFGADAARGRWLGGVALAHSTGEGGYRDHAETDHESRGSGELESTLTSVHPYLRLQASERLSLWGILGYGTGDLTLAVDAAGDRPRQSWKTDTEMWMAAAGARGVLLSAADTGGFELAARGDARLVRMNSDAATGADGAGRLAESESQTSRLRFILEGSHRIEMAGGQTLTPTLEVGLRHDGGDAETGTGIELGGGVRYADPATGLTVEGKARGLLAHEDADYAEWGASASVRLDPGAAGRGLSLSLSPAWGADSGNAERLWGLADARGLAANESFEPAGRLDAEAGWGFGAFGGRGLATPFAGLSLSDAGERTWRSGVRWTLGPDTAFGVEGSLREAANDNEAEHGVRFKFIARW